MKKDFIQKLSIAMASALVITSVAPAATAEAATMKMNKSSKILYLNADNSTDTGSDFDFNITNKGKDYKKKYTFKWSVSKDGIVDLNTKNGKVEAVGVGKTTVSCKVYKKSNKKLYKTIKATVEVKANAETVVISNQPTDGKMLVGTTFDFNRTMKNANGGKATDKTEWKLYADEKLTEESKIAKVDSQGVVTATEAGTFYVVARTYQSKATKDITTATSEAVKVTVPVTMTDLKLTKNDAVELTFDSSVKDLVKSNSDIKIETSATNRYYLPVETYTLSEDGKTLTVESYQTFNNDTTYTVSVAGMSKDFTAKIGDIASIVVENMTVAPVANDLSNVKTLKFKAFDANGVDISNKFSTDSSATRLIVNTSYNNGSHVDNDGKLMMFNKGDQVNVQLKYLKYNTTTGADESIPSNVAVITCAEATAAATSKWSIADASEPTKAYDKIVTSINAKATGKKLFVTLKDSYGAEIAPTKYESLTPNILVVDQNGNLYPQAAGTATIKVESGTYYDYCTIVVNPEATLSTIVADVNTYSLSNSDKLAAADNKTIKFTLKDNYGEKKAQNATATIETIQHTDAITLDVSLDSSKKGTFAITAGEGTVKFTANAGKTGTGIYRISAEGKTTVVTVNVATPAGATNYRIDMGRTEFDNFSTTDDVNKTTVKIYNVDANNVLVSEATGESLSFKVKDSNGNVAKDKTWTEIKGEFKTTNEWTLDAKALGLGAGTYTFELTAGPRVFTKTFTVKTSKKSASVTPKVVTIKNNGDTAVQSVLSKALKFVVDGQEKSLTTDVTVNNIKYLNLDTDVFTGTTVNSDGTASGGSIVFTSTKKSGRTFVKSVTFTVAGVEYTADVNQMITITAE